MNKLNYFLLVFLSLFVLTSIVVKPKPFEDYFKLDIDATIPEESFNGDIQKIIDELMLAENTEILKASNENI